MIRRAHISDVDNILLLETLCFQKGRLKREDILWLLRNPNALTFLDYENEARGALMLLMEEDVCRILSIAVHPSYRFKGIGKALIAIAEEQASRDNMTMVKLEVNARNRGAIEFYSKLGYERTGLIPHYYSWGDDAYSMRKILHQCAKT